MRNRPDTLPKKSPAQGSKPAPKIPAQAPPVPPKFNPDPYVKGNISREEVIELKVSMIDDQEQAFDIFDEDGSGSIDPKELTAAFEQMGLEAQSKMIYQVLGELDQDNSGGFDFNEFFALATSKQSVRDNRKDILRAFNLFDLNKEGIQEILFGGKVSFEELKRVAVDLGEYESDDQIRKFFKRADLDNDGFVTFDDFYNIMTNHPIYWG